MVALADAAYLAIGATVLGYRKARSLLPLPSVAPAIPFPVPAGHRAGRGSRSGRRAYDGAASGYRVDGWKTTGASANAEILAGLDSLRARSRDLIRNNPYGHRAIEALVSNLVGAGIRPMPATGDDKLDTQISELFEAWSKNCYPSNASNFYSLQSLQGRALFGDGEVIVRKRPRRMTDMRGLPPVQLQVLEGDHLPLEKNEALQNGGRIEQGVEFDVLDRRRAYHLLRSHPGGSLLLGGSYGSAAVWDTVRVPASDVVHLYQELRPGQVRGVPWLASVIIAVWDHVGYTDAERVRAKSASMLFASVQGGTPEEYEDYGDDEGNPDGIADHTDADGNLVTDADGYVVEALRPGMIAYLPDGKTIDVNQPGTAGGYSEYVRSSLREIAAGCGLSYEVLTQDLSQVNFSSIRLGLLEQHRLIRALREQVFIPFALAPQYAWFVDAAIAAGLLPQDDRCYRVQWSIPAIESATRKDDAEADALEIRNGLRGLGAAIAGRGQDPEKVLGDIAATNKLLDKLGIVLDSDPRKTTGSGVLSGEAAPEKNEGGSF